MDLPICVMWTFTSEKRDLLPKTIPQAIHNVCDKPVCRACSKLMSRRQIAKAASFYECLQLFLGIIHRQIPFSSPLMWKVLVPWKALWLPMASCLNGQTKPFTSQMASLFGSSPGQHSSEPSIPISSRHLFPYKVRDSGSDSYSCSRVTRRQGSRKEAFKGLALALRLQHSNHSFSLFCTCSARGSLHTQPLLKLLWKSYNTKTWPIKTCLRAVLPFCFSLRVALRQPPCSS